MAVAFKSVIYYVTPKIIFKVVPMYFVYVLHSKKHNKFYIGYTLDLDKRLLSYNKGLSKATKPFRPYKLVYYDAFVDKSDAKRRGKYT